LKSGGHLFYQFGSHFQFGRGQFLGRRRQVGIRAEYPVVVHRCKTRILSTRSQAAEVFPSLESDFGDYRPSPFSPAPF